MLRVGNVPKIFVFMRNVIWLVDFSFKTGKGCCIKDKVTLN